ncbi:hypothetical protein Esti_001815 [Eimeria stiedai]
MRCPSFLRHAGLKACLLPVLLLLPSSYASGQQQSYSGGDSGRQPVWLGRGREPNWGKWRWNSVKDLATAMDIWDNHINGLPISQPPQQQPPAAAAAAAAATHNTGNFHPVTPGVLASRANLAAAAANGGGAAWRHPIYSGGEHQNFYSPSSPVASPSRVPDGSQNPSVPLPAQPVRREISVLFSPKPPVVNGRRSGPPSPRTTSRSPAENYQRLHGNVTYSTNRNGYKEPQSQMSRSVGRSVSNYVGIGGEEKPANSILHSSNSSSSNSSFNPPAVQYTAGRSSASGVEQAAAESADETAETVQEEASSLMERRSVNPYDLSHIFPDIYNKPEPVSTESLMHQSLPLLEMTAVEARE